MRDSETRPRFKPGPDNPNFVRYGADYEYATPKLRLRQRLLAERGSRCERCGYAEIPQILEVHHIDRNRRNNRDENLKVLCPNCHSIDHLQMRDGQFVRLKHEN